MNIKSIIATLGCLLGVSSAQTQTQVTMEKLFVQTQIGNIAVFKSAHKSTKAPVIFLHGVYFDHHLWDTQIAAINDRTVYAIDMPDHGASTQNIKASWTLDDCAAMLIEVFDSLELKQVIAIGHS